MLLLLLLLLLKNSFHTEATSINKLSINCVVVMVAGLVIYGTDVGVGVFNANILVSDIMFIVFTSLLLRKMMQIKHF